MGSSCACFRDGAEISPNRKRNLVFKSPIFNNKAQCSVFVQEALTKIVLKCVNSPFQVKLIFRASNNHFSAEKFHQQTHGIKNTFVLAKTDQNRIFGGFSPCAWQKDSMYKYQKDENGTSFLFSLKSQDEKQNPQLDQNAKKVKIEHYQIINKQHSIMNHQQSGPIFGQGHDIFISDRCNTKQNWNNLGKSYTCPYAFGSSKANRLLAGKPNFLIIEYQVWAIITS